MSSEPTTTMKVGDNLFVVPVGTAKSDQSAKVARQRIYLEWLLCPTDERDPKTKKEMAALLDCTPQTLFAYEHEPKFVAEITRRLAHAVKVDNLPALVRALGQTALDPTNPRQVAAARTLMEWAYKAGGIPATDLGALTDEELARLAGDDGPSA
jgi:hypothetical protein